MTWGKLFNLSEPPLFCPQEGCSISTCFPCPRVGRERLYFKALVNCNLYKLWLMLISVFILNNNKNNKYPAMLLKKINSVASNWIWVFKEVGKDIFLSKISIFFQENRLNIGLSLILIQSSLNFYSLDMCETQSRMKEGKRISISPET